MILRDKTNILVDYDKDTRDLIANYDSDPSGVKLTDSQKYALHLWVSGFKRLKDTGQTRTVWERISMFLPVMGGNQFKGSINLKTNSSALTIGSDSTTGTFNSTGITGSAITNIIWNSTYASNLTLSSYIYNKGTIDGTLIASTAINTVNTPGIKYQHSTDSPIVSNTFYTVSTSPIKGFFGVSISGTTQASFIVVVNTRVIPQSFSSTTLNAPNNGAFQIGRTMAGSGGFNGYQNCILISELLTTKELLAVSHLNEFINAILNRSIR